MNRLVDSSVDHQRKWRIIVIAIINMGIFFSNIHVVCQLNQWIGNTPPWPEVIKTTEQASTLDGNLKYID